MPVISMEKYSDEGNAALCQIHRKWESVTFPEGSLEHKERGIIRKALLIFLDKLENGIFKYDEIITHLDYIDATGIEDLKFSKEMKIFESIYFSSIELGFVKFYITFESDGKIIELNPYSYFNERDKSKMVLIQESEETVNIETLKVDHRLKINWKPLT